MLLVVLFVCFILWFFTIEIPKNQKETTRLRSQVCRWEWHYTRATEQPSDNGEQSLIIISYFQKYSTLTIWNNAIIAHTTCNFFRSSDEHTPFYYTLVTAISFSNWIARKHWFLISFDAFWHRTRLITFKLIAVLCRCNSHF